MNPCSTLYGEHIQTGVYDTRIGGFCHTTIYLYMHIYAINFSSTSNCKYNAVLTLTRVNLTTVSMDIAKLFGSNAFL